MKKINQYLGAYSQDVQPDETIEQLLEDPIIRAFVLKHDLKHETIVGGINELLSYRDMKNICNQCQGIYECKLSTIGMTPILRYYANEITLEYTKCRFNNFDESKNKIDMMYLPKKVLNADITDFDFIGSERKEVHNYIMKFLNEYSPENPMKGLYLTGAFGTGKTYILAVIANELAKKGYRSIFAYYPDLVRELKSAISNGDLEEKIENLKKIPVLFLDDIGGENQTSFVRDEILGPILQHRVLDQLPTFFSSNMKMKVLMAAMQIQENDIEKTKAFRIFERIRELAVEFELSEKPSART
ncbi:MAG TPA: primosomal protein DnaI [Bacillota bacterium]|nr:primosomal protein DnaI [Bacillota bacterium]HPF41895.1 primosomal protein DnaI [Bacillota bacterium]HPJ85632.1 primosomal protein DnaI [Bacillota bacterium]HPQ61416.1 primosomal protein DnaI [Bacillota bacterium]HRX91304.1 primosomal protein DnaI [Candidatus Izemoplasmatales bacterium]